MISDKHLFLRSDISDPEYQELIEKELFKLGEIENFTNKIKTLKKEIIDTMNKEAASPKFFKEQRDIVFEAFFEKNGFLEIKDLSKEINRSSYFLIKES